MSNVNTKTKQKPNKQKQKLKQNKQQQKKREKNNKKQEDGRNTLLCYMCMALATHKNQGNFKCKITFP